MQQENKRVQYMAMGPLNLDNIAHRVFFFFDHRHTFHGMTMLCCMHARKRSVKARQIPEGVF
jgi:hypothetical protein